jgi:hypothetical protein
LNKRATSERRGPLPLVEKREQLVVHRAVRGGDLLARARPVAVERRDPPARLLEDRDQRRVVPGREPRVDGCVDRAFGDEDVLPEVPERAGVPGRRLERDQIAPVGGGDGGVGEVGDSGDANPLAVPERALPPACPPAVSERGRRDDSARDLFFTLERDQGRPDRDAAREVPRPVDRVDDPPDRSAVVSLLLAEDAFAGPALGDPVAERTLDGPVGVRDRCQVRLRVDL